MHLFKREKQSKNKKEREKPVISIKYPAYSFLGKISTHQVAS